MSKKGGKNAKPSTSYNVGDPVLGKIRGYPPWPGVIFDAAEAPKRVLSEQPAKNSLAHCVLFFPTGDFAWLHPKDLSSLKRHEIEAYLADESKKRNGELRDGYRIALDPREWLSNYDKQRVVAAQAEQDEQEKVDQLDSQEEVVDDKKKSNSSKKRKRDADDAPPKPKKAPKPKKDSEPTKKSAAGGKAKKNNSKSKAMVESEDDGDHGDANGEDENVGSSRKASPPPTKKPKRDKDDDGDDGKLSNDPQAIKVRDWRHKLQKVFLSNKTAPRAEAMPEIDQLVTTIENFDEMTIEHLQFSKIGKVMRHVAALPPEKIPRDSEFNFRTRAKALVEKWQEILNAHKQTSTPPPTTAESLTQAMNGAADATKGDTEDEVTQGTKNLDLNGNIADSSILSIAEPISMGDIDAPGDIAMSEA